MPQRPPIAIVGMGGVFPAAPTLETFWSNIRSGRSATREVPPGRWILDPADVHDPDAAADAVYSKRACFVEDFRFDARDLDVAPDILTDLDPVFELTLHAGREAFEAAVTEPLDRSRVGVALAAIALPTDGSSTLTRDVLGRVFEDRLFRQPPKPIALSTSPLNAQVTSLPAALLAAALKLGAGSFTLDAACASSLYAIKFACDALQAGRVDAMLAGGVSRPESLYTQMGFGLLQALSPSGTCRPFDSRADGLVVGEGAGLVMLKRLDDALRHGDDILAVIRGVGLSNDIAGSLLAADSEGQLRALRAAYEQAGWRPRDVDYIECHGTGTPLGDGVELTSLHALWEGEDAKPHACTLGAVKSNIGHLLTAAGAAGLIKTLLALRACELPPNVGCDSPVDALRQRNTPFQTHDEATEWRRNRPTQPRRAAVSAFGFGGINAHLLLEAWAPPVRICGMAPCAADTGADAGQTVHESRNTLCSTVNSDASEPIAIVGLAARFGRATALAALQDTLFDEAPVHQQRPAERWFGADAWPAYANLDCAARGAYIDNLDFPLGRFRIPPNEVGAILPQQLLMLEVAADALADAGMQDRETDPRAGAVIGMALDLNTSNYHLRWSIQRFYRNWAARLGIELEPSAAGDWLQSLRDAAGPPLNASRVLGSLGSTIASRVAREYKFGGLSFALSAGEASGLRALDVGIRALQRDELDRVLVGAVDLPGDIRALLALIAADQRYTRVSIAEGAGALVLKRLRDAERDNDRVYAVIRGCSFAGGAAPASADSQPLLAAIERALAETETPASNIGLWDLASPEDAAANVILSGLLMANPRHPAARADTRRRIGHAGAATGLLPLIQSVVSLRERALPPTPAETEIPTSSNAKNRPFHLPRTRQAWLHDTADGPRRAAAATLTHDGSAAAIILEEPPAALRRSGATRAHSAGRLPLAAFMIRAPRRSMPASLQSLADIATKGDEPFAARAQAWSQRPISPPSPDDITLTLVARSAVDLQHAISLAAEHIANHPERELDGREGVYYTPKPIGSSGKLAFVFPGSGSHFLGMGATLARHFPEILDDLEGETRRLRSQLVPEYVWPLRADWGPGWQRQARSTLDADVARLIIAQVAHGVFLSDVLRSLGIQPDAAIGYSLGETTSLFALRAWPNRDEMYDRLERSTLFRTELAGSCNAARKSWQWPVDRELNWHVVAINRPADDLRAALRNREHVYLLIVNAPRECVIGGERNAVEEVIADLGCEAAPIRGASTVHCPVVRAVEAQYRALHDLPTTPPSNIRFYSTARAAGYDLTSDDAANSITRQALQGFDFPKLIEQAYADGIRTFVEVGPQATCCRMIARVLGTRPHLALPTCLEHDDEAARVVRVLAALVAHEAVPDLTALYPPDAAAIAVPGPAASDRPQRGLRVPLGRPVFDPPQPPRVSPAASMPVREGETRPPEPAAAAPPIASSSIAALARSSAELATQLADTASARAAAQDSFLRFSQTATAGLGSALEAHSRWLQRAGYPNILEPSRTTSPETPAIRQDNLDASNHDAATRSVAFTREQCLEFARGSIANVLGPMFADVDTFPKRVRLPDEPLMLVDCITDITGEPGSLTAGTITTEHDVLPPGGWYLDANRMPVCVTVEAGQADLFLCSYLGIDLRVRGKRTYRLLDAQIRFHRDLPRPGETIRYEIAIDRFVQRGETYLFFFRFQGTINDHPLITMTDGCAGFFTEQEVDESRGIQLKPEDVAPVPRHLPEDWVELTPQANAHYSAAQLDALREGDLVTCFGSAFKGLPLVDPLTIPSGKMRLLDRIVDLEPRGGRFNLGLVRGEADIHPDDWFLTCHFVDDMVMPGTLMFECCAHTLRVLLLRLGWIGERDRVGWEPLHDVACKLKCRGPVTPGTKVVTYEVHVKEIGYNPEPYVIADALMYADGARIVQFTDMSLRLAGTNRDELVALWKDRHTTEPLETSRNSRESAVDEPVPIGNTAPPATVQPAVFDRHQIRAFATGKPSEAFGDPYRVFDEERRIARLPGPPFMFLDRVTAIRAEPWKLAADGWIESQYDVPADAWYFRANHQPSMPFCVLLEAALQPCGWFAAYLGSALHSSTDLRFRNLGGSATLHREVFHDAGTLTARIRITDVSKAGGMIVEKFDMQLWQDRKIVYDGDTYFGFFSDDALANQVGVRGARERMWQPDPIQRESAQAWLLEDTRPLTPDDDQTESATSLALPARAFRMIDAIDLFVPDGGPEGLGYIRGSTPVNPDAWFFKAHFYQDPVWPGSLGLESFLQLLKVVARHHWAHNLENTHRFEPITLGLRHEWTYRGQVIPTNQRVTVEAAITDLQPGANPTLRADGFLSVDGTCIYEMKNFGIRLIPANAL